jgi:hypothetical protein
VEDRAELDEAITRAAQHAHDAEEKFIEDPTAPAALPLAETVEHFAEDIDVLASDAVARERRV